MASLSRFLALPSGLEFGASHSCLFIDMKPDPNAKKNWKRLEDYKCPIKGCGAILREFTEETKDQSFTLLITHKCQKCAFQIGDERLKDIVVLKKRKFEPPEFMRQEERDRWV
jgi:hypothetical protein